MSLNAVDLFSERALGFKPSEIRELLKLIDNPEIIALNGGTPDDRFWPVDRVIEASTFALREYGKKALQYGSTEGIKKLRVLLMDRMEKAVSYTHLRAHETRHDLVCRLLLEKKKKNNTKKRIIERQK